MGCFFDVTRNGLPGGSGKDPLEVSIRLVSDDDSRISTNAIDTMQRVCNSNSCLVVVYLRLISVNCRSKKGWNCWKRLRLR